MNTDYNGHERIFAMKFMLDTDILNYIGSDDIFAKKVRALTQIGSLRIAITHIQKDQLEAENPKNEDDAKRIEEKRRRIESIPYDVVPVRGFVLGISEFGDYLGHDQDEDKIMPGRADDIRNLKDALIAVSSKEVDIFVTGDKKLRKKIQKNKNRVAIETWDYPRFCQYVDSLYK